MSREIEAIEWIVQNGSDAGEVLTSSFDGGRVLKVGRLQSAHLYLGEASVSRMHAVIEKRADGTLQLVDLGSAMGTFINGQKITKSDLRGGDIVCFGRMELIVRLVLEGQATQQIPIAQSGETAPLADAPRLEGDGMEVVQIEEVSQDIEHAEPYTLQGYYDEHGNYIPGYYDDQGTYHLGYGYWDEAGEWCVAYGYHDPSGEWVDDDLSLAAGEEEARGDIYSSHCFGASSGDTLEIAMLWSDQVLSVNQYPEARDVTIGVGEESDFVIELPVADTGITQENFPLVMHDATGAGYYLALTPQMTGFVRHYEQTWSIEEVLRREDLVRSERAPGAMLLPIGKKTSARVELDEVTFLVSFTERESAIAGIGVGDFRPLPFLIASAAAHLMFLFMALTIPASPDSLELDSNGMDDRFVQLVLMPEQEEEVEDESPAGLDNDGKDGAEKVAGDEGKAGREDMEDRDRSMAAKGTSDSNEFSGDDHNRQVAQDSGVLAVLGGGNISPFGPSDRNVGSNAIAAIGNMEDQPAGDSGGFGGLGLTDSGRGGGGDDESVKLDSNAICSGAACGTKCKFKDKSKCKGGKGNLPDADITKDENTVEPTFIPGPVETRDCMAREQIARVVRQRRNEIRACYERELQRDKSLAGQIKIHFKIGATGSVFMTKIKSSSLKNKRVEQCVQNKVRRWIFPEPQGCSMVNVTYPFNFKN